MRSPELMPTMLRRPELILLVGVLLSGCVSTAAIISTDSVAVADAVILSLPSAAELTQTMAATQLLTGSYEENTFSIHVELEWRPGSIALVGLNNFGALLFSMTYDGSVLETRGSQVLMRGLQPEYVLADILITMWERPMLDRHLLSQDIAIEDTPARRTLYRGGMPIITIDYETGSRTLGDVHYVHRERGYELLIQTVRLDRE